MGGLGVKKCLTQGCPCSGGGPVFPSDEHSSANRVLLLLVTVFMPGETFLIEGYDDLWALMIGFLGKHEIRLIRVFPARKKIGWKVGGYTPLS